MRSAISATFESVGAASSTARAILAAPASSGVAYAAWCGSAAIALGASWKRFDASLSAVTRVTAATTSASRFALVAKCASTVFGDTPAAPAIAGIVVRAQPRSSKLTFADARIVLRVRSAAAMRVGAW